MTFYLALAATILSSASILLHFIAPRTKNKYDDAAVKLVDSAIEKLK